MDFEKNKKKIQNVMKLNGFLITSDLCEYILESWNQETFNNLNDWIDKIVDNIRRQSLSHSNLTETEIKIAVKNSLKSGLVETETVFSVIQAYDVPKFIYNIDRKKFVSDSSKLVLFPGANQKADLFSYRYAIILQRVLRNPVFKRKALGDGENVQLLTIEMLITGSKKENAIVLGLLNQVSEGKWRLEDPTASVEIDLSNASYHNGFYTENCILLCDGTYDDKILHVHGIAHPPVESPSETRCYLGETNMFGGPSKKSLTLSDKLKKIEEKVDNSIVFLSDVWLDKIEVLQKLKILFQGYNAAAPIAFVFCGNFLEDEKGVEKAYQLKSLLKGLSDLISLFDNLMKYTTFIFVPGNNDPNAAKILPRPPFLKYITEEFRKKVPKSAFATNPCRIQYCTQEIVVMREDLMTKMFRNTIHFPEKDESFTEHFAKTILGQGHLSPFTLNVLPVYWCYDYVLSLYPNPDVLVLADKFKAYTHVYQGTTVINPGPFSTNHYSFKVYHPRTRETDDSYIPKDI